VASAVFLTNTSFNHDNCDCVSEYWHFRTAAGILRSL